MDSLLTRKVYQIANIQDSILSHTSTIQLRLEDLENENLFLKFLPFLGVIIGGFIAYYGQLKLKNKDIEIETKKRIGETVSKIMANAINLEFTLGELAYLEVDSKYQYHISLDPVGTYETQRAFEEHYNDYKYINECKTKICSFLSEINTGFTLYYRTKNLEIPTELKNMLTNLKSHIQDLPRQNEYDSRQTITTEVLEADIQILKIIYTQHLPQLYGAIDKLI